jgi:hypothetical protein
MIALSKVAVQVDNTLGGDVRLVQGGNIAAIPKYANLFAHIPL